jgi:formylglycine-generating enzyme required for sulfatase activity
MKLTLVPSGEFLMGNGKSAEDEVAYFNKIYGETVLAPAFFKDEYPQHRVRITKAFYLGTYHVTVGQFRKFVEETAYKTDAEKGEKPGASGWDPDKKDFAFNEKYSWRDPSFEQTDEHPVVNMSWNDATAFCQWLSKKEGETYRLPTEAEWEYACRAGTTTHYHSGDDPETLAKVANVPDAALKAKFPDWKYTIQGNDGYAFTSPVGSFAPNAFGLYDMHANTWQWCADWYAADYYAASPLDDPTGPASGDRRVIRGGAWFSRPSSLLAAKRDTFGPNYRYNGPGFRVARTIADATRQITNSIGMKLTLVPSGEFMMGSGESAAAAAAFFNKTCGADDLKADNFKDEYPQHRVRITQTFYLGTYHVTRGQFRQFVADTSYKTDAEKGEKPGAWRWDPDKKAFGFYEKYSWLNVGFEQTDEHPVVDVSWNDAVAFCKWLSKKEGRTYRLPTEAEWEFACRAGTTTRYYSGDDPETLAKVGNVADATFKAKSPDTKYTIKASDGYPFTSPVGSFRPNALGLYDMHGNAWQWCADWYREEYYAASPAEDPAGPDSGSRRVHRGGSWYYGPDVTRSAKRGGGEPDFRGSGVGFRVARTQ